MLIHALALLLAQISPAPRVPSIEFASRPLSAWCDEFEGSGHLSHDALWCVYWHGPDDTITTKLVEWLAVTPSESIRAELEVILHHRGIPHPCTQRGLDDLAFDIARPDLATPTLELQAALDSRDPGRVLDAASALVRRDEDAAFAVRSVLMRTAMDPLLVRALVDFAGMPADRAICDLLDDLHVDFAVKEHVLTTIGFSVGANVDVVATTLARFASRADAIGATARRRFVDVLFGEDPWRDWNAADGDTLHFVAHWPKRTRIEDSNAARMFGDALAHWLAALPATSCPDASEFWLVLEAARRSDAIARSITPALLPWLEESPERATFARGILAHAGCIDAALQDAVAKYWNARADDSTNADGVAPCLREYAAPTWTAFERAFASASDDDRARCMLPLADAGKLDGNREPLARASIDAAAKARAFGAGWSGSHLFELGARGTFEVVDGASDLTNIYRLAITARTLRDSGGDPSKPLHQLQDILRTTPEPQGVFGFTDTYAWGFDVMSKLAMGTPEFDRWCVDWLVRDGDDKYHEEDIAAYLATRELAAELRPFVFHARGMFVDTLFPDLFVRQGELALETLARWPRLRVESRWKGSPRLDLSGLERILRLTALTPADHHDLARAMRHCIAVDRLEALRFVKRHGLASDELRAAIAAARTDCDDRVRALAQE
jgi:hypothetical protein